MASILEKTQTLIQANLHAMVDKALEKNSVAVMKQYIRDAEKNLDELEKATATVGGEVKTMERKYKEYKKKANSLVEVYKSKDHFIKILKIFLLDGGFKNGKIDIFRQQFA